VTQLVYHPAFDPYNALLRMVRILAASPEGLDPTALRILDFYLLFPESLADARLTPQLRSLVRRLAAEPRYPYDKLPATKTLFERMESSHEAARQTLLAKGFAAANGSKIRLLANRLPTELLDLVDEQNKNEASLMAAISSIAAAFSTEGPNGLKDRSGLAEYRYDVV
jgi:hypothetical protein